MPIQGPGGQTQNPSSLTIAQVFANKNLWLWWEQNGGKGTNMFDGVSEKGIDYSTNFGTPVGVPVGGKVLRIVHNVTSVGDVVELQDSSGAVWLYQHITATVRVNQTLGVGGIVGTENGLPIDQYSTGPHIEVRYAMPGTWNPAIDSWYEPWVNPYAIFSQLSSQLASGSIDSGGLFATFANLKNPLAANANVTAVLIAIDQFGALINPFDTSQENVPTDSIAGATFTDPMAWLGAVGGNLFGDMRAVIFRFILILIGVLLFYQGLKKFVDVGAIVNTGAQIGKLAAMV